MSGSGIVFDCTFILVDSEGTINASLDGICSTASNY